MTNVTIESLRIQNKLLRNIKDEGNKKIDNGIFYLDWFFNNESPILRELAELLFSRNELFFNIIESYTERNYCETTAQITILHSIIDQVNYGNVSLNPKFKQKYKKWLETKSIDYGPNLFSFKHNRYPKLTLEQFLDACKKFVTEQSQRI